MISDEGRPLCGGHDGIGLVQRPPVDDAEIAFHGRRRPFAGTEAVLAADV